MKSIYSYRVAVLIADKKDEKNNKNSASFKSVFCKCGREYKVTPRVAELVNKASGNFWECGSCGFKMTSEYLKNQLKNE